jgi:hypothetical protein
MEAQAIAEVLGGRKVLGKAVTKADDLAQLVRRGLPAVSVTALAERLHLGNSVLGAEAGYPSAHAHTSAQPRIASDASRIGSYGSDGTSIC